MDKITKKTDEGRQKRSGINDGGKRRKECR